MYSLTYHECGFRKLIRVHPQSMNNLMPVLGIIQVHCRQVGNREQIVAKKIYFNRAVARSTL